MSYVGAEGRQASIQLGFVVTDDLQSLLVAGSSHSCFEFAMQDDMLLASVQQASGRV